MLNEEGGNNKKVFYSRTGFPFFALPHPRVSRKRGEKCVLANSGFLLFSFSFSSFIPGCFFLFFVSSLAEAPCVWSWYGSRWVLEYFPTSGTISLSLIASLRGSVSPPLFRCEPLRESHSLRVLFPFLSWPARSKKQKKATKTAIKKKLFPLGCKI